MYEPTKIAEIIKKTAKSKDIQLKEMLISLNLNKNTLSNMYNGSMLKGDSLAKIADYLDCSVDYLLGRTEQQKIAPIKNNESKKVKYNSINGDNNIQVNGNNSPTTVTTSEHQDEMTAELIKRFTSLPFDKKLEVFDYMKNL